MSTDEDNELRDLVAQTLENNGVLGKIRAQLRANVFLAIEEQESKQNKIPLQNKQLKEFLNTDDGKLVTCLVREFLEFFNLEFTKAVFDPETCLGKNYKYEGRADLCRQIQMEYDKNESSPLLVEIMLKGKANGFKSKNTNPPELSSRQIIDVEKIFNSKGKDKVDKEGLKDLFAELLPNFSRNMLNQFVNDEFLSFAKTYDSEVEVTEFCQMYQHLFKQCYGVVTHDTSSQISNKPINNKLNLQNNSLTPFPSQEKLEREQSLNLKLNPNGNFLRFNTFSEQISQDIEVSEKEMKSLEDDLKFEVNNDSEDSFFDDPLPVEKKTANFPNREEKPISRNEEKKSLDTAQSEKIESKTKTSLLGDLPALTGGKGLLTPPLAPISGGNKSPTWKDLETIDKRIAELGFNAPPDDDYEEDFQSSISMKSSKKSPTDHSIEEDIEDFSGIADDLLNSTASGADDLTTDKTVSQISGAGIDYLESFG